VETGESGKKNGANEKRNANPHIRLKLISPPKRENRDTKNNSIQRWEKKAPYEKEKG